MRHRVDERGRGEAEGNWHIKTSKEEKKNRDKEQQVCKSISFVQAGDGVEEKLIFWSYADSSVASCWDAV